MSGRLLLKCDGVIADSWCPLDPEPPYVPPDRWDALHVQIRFAEAIGTVQRMPLGRMFPSGYRTSWPDWYREWDQMMSACTNVEAMAATGQISHELYAAHQQWQTDRNQYRRDPPTSVEISAMEKAIQWPGTYLRDRADEARALNLICFARARELDVSDVAKRGKHDRVKSASRWQELGLAAAERVAIGLRVDCVAVF